jgi:two-component system KDP operon response regulator KdpE
MNNPASINILVVDDEIAIRKLLDITLSSNGYKVFHAATAREGLLMAANHPPQLIILDLGLSDENGHQVLKKLREWYHSPVIILSAQSNEEDIVKALDNGANDYLVKPFRTGELLARIRSALRNDNGSEQSARYNSKQLQIDLVARTVKKNNVPVKLTVTEFTLLALMVVNEGRVLTHRYILNKVWGPSYIDQSQYLRVYVAQLRKKIENDSNRPEHILTESGVGYRFILGE